MAIFEQYEPCSWEVGNAQGRLVFPITSINETGGNRIVERNRPYRDGAKLDDIGSQPIKWTVEAIFENSIDEDGIPEDPPLYPNVLRSVVDSFRIHGTGDLTLPTVGKVRARAHSYTRIESDQQRDYARLSLVFVEDNEDNVDAQSFQLPTVNASAKRVTETAEFDAQSGATWNTSVSDIREFGAELEGIANAPGDRLDELDQQASIVVSTTNSVIRTFSRGGSREEGNLLNDPSQSRTQRKLEQTKDLAGRSRSNSLAGRPRIVPYQVDQGTDIFTVAAQLNQSSKDLLDINPGINPFFIPRKTVIKVFEEA